MQPCTKTLTEICTSTSIGEAQSSASQLTKLIQQVLESNSEMSRRLANLEMQTLGQSHSTVQPLAASNIYRNDHAMVDTNAAVEPHRGSSSVGEHTRASEENGEAISTETEDLKRINFSFTFDQDLNNSRVYSRAIKRGSVWSTASSAVHTTSWSCLSGLSLAEVSELSVIGLPISAKELSNGHRFELTDAELTQALEENDISIMDDHVDHRFSGTDRRALETRRPISLLKEPRSMGDSSVLHKDRPSRKHAFTVGGNVLEPKRIMLLGMTLIGFD